MKIIYTCIFGKKDKLNEEVNTTGAKAICFTDDPTLKSKVWNIVLVEGLTGNVRRQSRKPKILAHKFLPKETEYSLYLDANIICKVPIKRLINEWLEDTDIAMFRHPTRDCYFDEAKECIRLELDDKKVIENQCIRYKNYPRHMGLCQGGVILRRHTPKIETFNEFWWKEYENGSHRDQISFPIAVEETQIAVNSIIGNPYSHPYFEMTNHLILSEWAGKV